MGCYQSLNVALTFAMANRPVVTFPSSLNATQNLDHLRSLFVLNEAPYTCIKGTTFTYWKETQKTLKILETDFQLILWAYMSLNLNEML